ncbi:MAG: FixX-related protein [Oscillospiraceae bacterium]|nr:FixX-related protein [Oscillospiraceae bacterium]
MSTQTKADIEEKLYLNHYTVDTQSHLSIKEQSVCAACQRKICLTICPAKVYEIRDGETSISYEGCLECGACRITCPHSNIEWTLPRGGFGIQYRLA